MNDHAACMRWGRWAWSTIRGTRPDLPQAPLPDALIRAQRLEGLLYAALRASGDERQGRFAVDAREIVASNLIRPIALAPVLAALDAAGVKALVFKGAATTERFELLKGIRGVGDADLLVSPAEFRSARRVLIDLGFAEERSGEPLSYWSNNERSFVGGSPELPIDLHRGLHRWPLFSELAADALADAERGTLGWTPSLISTPLLAAAHRAKHGYTADARELLDVASAFETYEHRDFTTLVVRSGQLRMSGALYALWSLVRAWFGPTSRAETRAYAELRASLGWRRGLLDRLVALDSPSDENKPWRGRAFLKLYVPHPLLAERWASPAALLAAHVLLRGADRVVGGSMVLEPGSR